MLKAEKKQNRHCHELNPRIFLYILNICKKKTVAREQQM